MKEPVFLASVLPHLAETEAPSTIPTTTPEWRRKRNIFFETFSEKPLDRALQETYAFCDAMLNDGKPHWLSLIGKSGVGKTHLLKDCHAFTRRCYKRWLDGMPYLRNHFTEPPKMLEWPRAVAQIKSGDWNISRCLMDWSDIPVLFLDEIGADKDQSGFVADALARLLSLRVGKWTFLTSNQTRQGMAEIDARIASRLIRDENVLVELNNTTDYALRKRN